MPNYPTEDAYLAVCRARDSWQARAETAEAVLKKVADLLHVLLIPPVNTSGVSLALLKDRKERGINFCSKCGTFLQSFPCPHCTRQQPLASPEIPPST